MMNSSCRSNSRGSKRLFKAAPVSFTAHSPQKYRVTLDARGKHSIDRTRRRPFRRPGRRRLPAYDAGRRGSPWLAGGDHRPHRLPTSKVGPQGLEDVCLRRLIDDSARRTAAEGDRKWSRWKAQQRYREKAAGKQKRNGQSVRYRERVRSRKPAEPEAVNEVARVAVNQDCFFKLEGRLGANYRIRMGVYFQRAEAKKLIPGNFNL
jgi:hypothetical protein